LIPWIEHEHQFFTLRRSVLAKQTTREQQIEHKILPTGLKDETLNQKTVKAMSTRQEKQATKFDTTLFLHYTHEQRLQSLKRDIHKIYAETFLGTPDEDVRLVVGHRNNPNISYELMQKRPPPSMLKPPVLPRKAIVIVISSIDRVFLDMKKPPSKRKIH
jgi:hypothetical protein